MDLVLLPQSGGSDLKDIYHRAFRQAEELYILSAYLTEWDVDVELGRHCKSFAFIVGKDFGITRKAACQKVIQWLPRYRHTQFLVAELIDGFHPKAIFWRESDGRCYALVGSSNLSKAAFATNREANGYSKIPKKTYDAAKQWILRLKDSCVILNQSWLNGYREAKQSSKPASAKEDPDMSSRVFNLQLPSSKAVAQLGSALDFRRSQMLTFEYHQAELVHLLKSAARARIWSDSKNETFYQEFRQLWDFGDGSRFQANGWERRGKQSDFREFARSLVRVLEATSQDRDKVVVIEINRLTEEKVETRRSVFTEMLCQFFPDRYHVANDPVSKWLRSTGSSSPWGASAGYKYLEEALLLRAALENAKRKKGGYPVENLAVLDVVIVLKMQRRGQSEENPYEG
ncbi:HKD family nuclease [Pseudomonas helmanticensis]|uniref:HKD family nuclease n=1 Tax=Pseudomonas helmanticensis TaxID=1471381 RepID=A0ACD2U7I7_9PSED|nr:phospholipase D family protein [Pseudomonas helmanticensis]SMQ26836.1 HKD family nuclease [Pseudomonas helmanticensis]